MISPKTARRLTCALLAASALAGSASFLTSSAQAASAAEEGAISWARPYADRHDTSFNGLCLSFVFDAYSAAGVNLRSWVTVGIGSNTYPSDIWGHFSHGTTGGGTPPYGALVFWKPQNGDRTNSHVALSLGGGNIVSTSDGVADYTHYETTAAHAYAVYQGWWLPDGVAGGGGGGPPGEGSFISHNGFVYRIAGGAPIYVSNWGAVGGPQSARPLSDAEFAALPQYPRDGAILDSSSGQVYVAAGGAPIYVSNWGAIGGPKAGVGIDQAAIDNAGGGVPWDHLRRYPANGTVLDSSSGRVFIAAGGAALYLSNWGAIGGPKAGVGIDQAAIDNAGGGSPWNHIRPYPADGTILDSSGGGVFIVAGGAPLYLSNWNAIGGPRPGVGIDQWDIDQAGANPNAHLRAYPADGTLISTSGDGRVYVIAGGAPLYLSNWAAIGGAQPAATVDQWDVENTADPAAHLRQYPADGTFINTSTGRVYRIAGGAPIYVSNWSVFGGVQPYVDVDQWDVDNTADPHAHLRATPLDGTVVEGLPSKQFWGFGSGVRTAIAPDAHAVTVDDAGLATFGIAGLTSKGATKAGAATHHRHRRHRGVHHHHHRHRHTHHHRR